MCIRDSSLTGQKTARVYGNFSVKYDIIKNLSLTYRIGYDTYNEQHALTINKGGKSTATPVELEYERGIYRTVDATNRIWDHAFILQYQTKITDDLRFDVTAGAQANNE